MDRGRANIVFGGIGALAFFGILGLELATETDAVSLADIGVDALTLFLTIASAASVAALAIGVREERAERAALVAELKAARTEGGRWRAAAAPHLDGLSAEIARQFDQWALTPAERDIALFVLKGFSHKEIATLRRTSEATVRQQAQGVYRKAGLAGKTALSAFFLDGLMAGEAPNGGTPAAEERGPATLQTPDQLV